MVNPVRNYENYTSLSKSSPLKNKLHDILGNKKSKSNISNGVKVYLGIGSNLGDRCGHIQKAITYLKKVKNVKITKCSSLYETKPVGYKKQPWFINCALELETSLPPEELLKNLTRIEKALGRKREVKWRPRLIDLDILFYGQRIIKNEDLNIPHPEIAKRKFVLIPLDEINPRIYHPQLKKTVSQILNGLRNNKQEVVKFSCLRG